MTPPELLEAMPVGGPAGGSEGGRGVPLVGQRVASRRRWSNRVAVAGMTLALALSVGFVGLILYHVVSQGIGAMSWDFLTQPPPYSFRRTGGGFVNGLIGTAIMVGLATAVATPVGVLAAIYLAEYGKRNPVAQVIRFFSDVMTGVPSVFVGLFIYTALVVSYGFGAVMGAAALAIIELPIIVRSSEEMLKLVSPDLRNASHALGASKWQTTLKVVLPSALPGVVTGVMLAVARAAGETAPLILTVLGAQAVVTKLVNAPIAALPLQIFAGASTPFVAGQQRAWAGALELVAIVLIFTLVARVAASRSRI